MLLLLAAKSLQSCPTLCDPIDGSPPGSPVPGILHARTLEWVAISFSNAWKWKVKVKSLSRIRLFTTPWAAAYQAPLPTGFSSQEYWNGVPLPSPYSKFFQFFPHLYGNFYTRTSYESPWSNITQILECIKHVLIFSFIGIIILSQLSSQVYTGVVLFQLVTENI